MAQRTDGYRMEPVRAAFDEGAWDVLGVSWSGIWHRVAEHAFIKAWGICGKVTPHDVSVKTEEVGIAPATACHEGMTVFYIPECGVGEECFFT
ncbi:MAG: hypothetical protein NZM03_00645 [Limisphaera sp.]|nr:hypothetical protein [Limisphaera sp.]